MRIASLGPPVFAMTMIALGILGLFTGELAPVWQAVPEGFPGRGALAWLSTIVSLLAGAGLLWRRMAAPAARALLGLFLSWLLLFKLPVVLASPREPVSWEDAGETVVMVAAAWTLYATCASEWERQHLGFATGANGVRAARTLFGSALLAFGQSHFADLQETAALVPAWLPAHTAWASATGATYCAAGVAILAGVLPRLAAVLSTLQMGLFTLLVWAPVLAAGPTDASQLSEGAISWALSCGAWVVADSYRGLPWFDVGRRRTACGSTPRDQL